ncbi:SDR family NAD(P)-dependent oxidoreductase [Hoeflea sp. Naph1]|uniref:SDR family NAD(P)-dependent oxidoreductase n=1 Tax=Hoeflea sp. Naph1 TaxID=3388653 RepID=UPI00398FF5CC
MSMANTSSTAVLSGGGAGSVPYACSKASVEMLTRGLANELAEHNIRVNAVRPGLTLTPLHQQLTPPKVMEKMTATIVMRRPASAGAYLYLASEKLVSFVTGSVIAFDGGGHNPHWATAGYTGRSGYAG